METSVALVNSAFRLVRRFRRKRRDGKRRVALQSVHVGRNDFLVPLLFVRMTEVTRLALEILHDLLRFELGLGRLSTETTGVSTELLLR